jgi:hypothetical protein
MRQFFAKFKYFTASLLFLLTTAMSSGGAVFAYSNNNPGNDFHKVYVCKYVGTPGVNERLQTGDNPIDVDTHSLSNFTGLGSFFNDEQGRSVAIAWDNGDKIEPSVSMCPTVENTPVTPAVVTFYDVCGTANDTYTIPSTAGVDYKVGGVTKTTGTYAATGTVTVTAVAQTGYTLTGTTSWSKEFTNVACTVGVTPGAVTFYEACGMANDTYTIPMTTGVNYQVGGVTKAAGTYAGSGTVTVTAVAQTGYVLSGTTTWSHSFTNVACPCTCNENMPVTATIPTFYDVCGVQNDTYTIPSKVGVYYQVNGVTKAAGTYTAMGTLNIEAFALSGYELTGTHSWSHVFTDVPCVTKVYPPRVIFEDLCGMENDTFTIPSKVGVDYKINGNIVAAGSYNASDFAVNGTVTVTAVAQAGYMLNGHVTSWTHHFTNESCGGQGGELTPVAPAVATFADVCATINDTYTIPSTMGVTYRVNGVVTAAGTYPATGTVTVVAEAQAGFKLTGTTSWSHTFTNEACAVTPPAGGSGGQVLGESTVVFTSAPVAGRGAEVQAAELANTGQNSLTSAIAAFVIAISALLVYAFGQKRQLS